MANCIVLFTSNTVHKISSYQSSCHAPPPARKEGWACYYNTNKYIIITDNRYVTYCTTVLYFSTCSCISSSTTLSIFICVCDLFFYFVINSKRFIVAYTIFFNTIALSFSLVHLVQRTLSTKKIKFSDWFVQRHEIFNFTYNYVQLLYNTTLLYYYYMY